MISSAGSNPRVHIVGAGIAGLACAVRLARAGRPVVLYEAAGQAGGRCRSLFDAKLGRSIDNGNHLLLSANREALDYVAEIGARDRLIGPPRAAFPFVDLKTGERWTLRPNAGPIPWWIFDASRRIPGTRPGAYLAGLRLAAAGAEDRVGDLIAHGDPLWARFWEPLTVAALNTAPTEASARLLWLVLRETFAKGEAACRPLIARDGLADALVEPALALLRARGAEVRFNWRLRGFASKEDRVIALDFPDDRVTLGPDDPVALALPPAVTGALIPGLAVPNDSRPIVNAHILLPGKPDLPENLPFLGLVGGSADWIFLRGDLASLTVSAAERLVDLPNEEVARLLWHDTASALGFPEDPMPPVRVIKEKRATFAQTPEALARRAKPRTAWRNLVLAGDWTDTGYPATIESAVRSGRTAARLVLEG
ncbi:MAG: hydroxysqualene dehydroxylase HpnE [Kiloniellales bacterium]